MGSTRTIRSYGDLGNLYLDGLTQGPAAGWAWDGAALTHPIGTRITFTPEAAARIDETVRAAIPARSESLTGLQVSRLPEGERAAYVFSHTSEDLAVGFYTRTWKPQPTSIDIDSADVVSLTNGGR